MFSKIFLAVLAIAVLVMAFFTYYSWSWLQSIGSPQAAIDGYQYNAGMAWLILWVFAAILLALGNAVLWTSKRSWALWATFLYFSTFIVVRYFWLERTFSDFENRRAGIENLSIAPIIAVSLIVLYAIIVFFNVFLVIRLQAKTHPVAEEQSEPEAAAE